MAKYKTPGKVEIQVGACGFERKTEDIFDIELGSTDRHKLHFFTLEDSAYTFEQFDGVMIPSGVFERINFVSNVMGGGGFWDLRCEKPELLRRERELRNLITKGGWVCVLLDSVIDRVADSSYGSRDISDFDLAKKIMNSLHIVRTPIKDGASVLECASDEFRHYFKDFAVAHTILNFKNKDYRKLATFDGSKVVSAACDNRFFFLPFHFNGVASSNLISAIDSAVSGIMEFRAKNEIILPSWLDEFSFERERTLATEICKLQNDLQEFKAEQKCLKEYKSILTISGSALVEQIHKILRVFFGLTIEAVENFVEDAKILDSETGAILVAVEIKGVNSGVKREQINQVDSHRERLNLSSETPGLLIINDSAKVEGLNARWEISVNVDQCKHAARINVTILRTVDLLLFMQTVEGLSIEKRRLELLDKITNGSGWLRHVDKQFRLITE